MNITSAPARGPNFAGPPSWRICAAAISRSMPSPSRSNPASRGLLLDPTNGLSDIEHGEVRALTIHSFTNQPVRLLRALRFAARMGFKLESRTQEWFNLAIERELQLSITPEDAGEELRSLSREERPHLVLKEWEDNDLMEYFSATSRRSIPATTPSTDSSRCATICSWPAFGRA